MARTYINSVKYEDFLRHIEPIANELNITIDIVANLLFPTDGTAPYYVADVGLTHVDESCVKFAKYLFKQRMGKISKLESCLKSPIKPSVSGTITSTRKWVDKLKSKV